MKKSLVTNLISLLVVICGFYSPIYSTEIFMAGLFALSGGITNWIAIHMLFEKIPFFYGSGVIPERFEEFKIGIKNLILKEFFSEDIINNFIENKINSNKNSIIQKIDHELIFKKLLEAIKESSLGSVVEMVGGEKSLEPLKIPVQKKIEEIFEEFSESDIFKNEISSKNLVGNLETIIDKRLQELTPEQVKTIIKDMIEKHLGWLVVWGGVFGFLIGAILGLIGRIN